MRFRCLVGVALLVVAAQAHADSTGRLTGLVRDETGAPLPGVSVQARPLEVGSERQATTGLDGRYALALAPGRYEVVFRLPSFATSVRSVAVSDGGRRARRRDSPDRTQRRRARDGAAYLSEPDRHRRAGQRPRRPGEARLRGRRDARSRSRRAPCTARARSSRPCPASSSASTAARARRTSTTSAASTSITGPTSPRAVAGVPVNMPTHAHGQGYSDNNFLIPELVSRRPVPEGYLLRGRGRLLRGGRRQRQLPEPARPSARSKLEGGEHGFRPCPLRGLARAAARATALRGRGVPQRRPVGRVPTTIASSTASCATRAATSRQRLQRDGDGLLRPLELDGPGRPSAPSTSGLHRPLRRASTRRTAARRTATASPASGARARGAGLTQVKAYGIDYALDLFSNFTYFLDDPVNGDQFEQKDARRVVGGERQPAVPRALVRPATRRASSGCRDATTHPHARPLPHRGAERLSTVRQDDVGQASGALFFQTSIQWTRHSGRWPGCAATSTTSTSRATIPGTPGAERDASRAPS